LVPIEEVAVLVTGAEATAVRQALRRILPPSASVAVWDGDAMPELLDGEVEAVAGAVPARKLEFARGRACARRALLEAGGPALAIPVGAGRAPQWPAGYAGSISHCDGLVVAAVAAGGLVRSLGIDAEPERALPDDVRALVLRPSEPAGGERLIHETVAFSAKESVHKAMFPQSGEWMDFLDVELRLDVALGQFTVVRVSGAVGMGPGLEEIRGRFAIAAGYVLTAAWLEAP
jgi:4'-phosphopantetheinyl transferase EntD